MKEGLKKLKEVTKDMSREDILRQLYYSLNAEKRIPWQKYDPKNPPELNKRFLIIDDEKQLHTATLERPDKFGLSWWESRGLGYIGGVTHYAPINLPREDIK